MADMRFAGVSFGPEVSGRVSDAEELTPADQVDVYVGRRLRERRKEFGISQDRLGRKLGLTFSQVQKYEKGSNRIGAGRLYHIAAILNVPVQYFFDGLGKPEFEPSIGNTEMPLDSVTLQELFGRISDPNARQALLSLASSMASG